MMTTQAMLDERYGRRSTRGRRGAWVVAGAVALAAVGALGWTTVSSALDTVDVDATAFEVRDARTVVIGFEVQAPAGRAFACALEAQDEQHGVVGWRIVEFAASDGSRTAHTETVPTVATATTGLVNACWVT